MIQIEEDTLIDRIINVDNEGNFAITVPENPNAPKGLQYQISTITFTPTS
ncbi:hypothetical protein H1P_1220017 [Hyella patelloides LEGE 07179]|uniref:Uncharacterized protein n=1 Tax=Hyella patelloides LEGE 07179 TaxID=945734 RepID=A0A563VKB0_9CYAN|nr:hypothetical protein [Hyella patelloides]VEP11848.1 hypothetical protein H1P_1220017 [Hyella patelloides LEGE 07179]